MSLATRRPPEKRSWSIAERKERGLGGKRSSLVLRSLDYLNRRKSTTTNGWKRKHEPKPSGDGIRYPAPLEVDAAHTPRDLASVAAATAPSAAAEPLSRMEKRALRKTRSWYDMDEEGADDYYTPSRPATNCCTPKSMVSIYFASRNWRNIS